MYVERLKINLKNIFFFSLVLFVYTLIYKVKKKIYITDFWLFEYSRPQNWQLWWNLFKKPGENMFSSTLTKTKQKGGVPKRQKIKYNWWYCLIRQKMRIKKTISELLEVSIELWPKPRNLKKRVNFQHFQTRKKAPYSTASYLFCIRETIVSHKVLPRRISVRFYFFAIKEALISEIQKKGWPHIIISPKDSKKVNIFEIGSLEVYNRGGGPRVYTVLRPYMYTYNNTCNITT